MSVLKAAFGRTEPAPALDRAALAQAKAAIEVLDLSAENTKLDAIDREIAELEAARDRARQRISDHANGRHQAEESNVSDVVAGLLRGEDPDTAALASVATGSERERADALRKALPELQGRIEFARQRAGRIKLEAERRVREAAAPFTAAIMAEAREAAERIAVAYAALNVLPGLSEGDLRTLSGCTRKLAGERLLEPRNEYTVPAEALDLHAAIARKGRAAGSYQYTAPATVDRPR